MIQSLESLHEAEKYVWPDRRRQKKMSALSDDIWSRIMGIGIETKTLDYRDLCSLSITCRRLRRLASEDPFWSLFLHFHYGFDLSLFKCDIEDSTELPDDIWRRIMEIGIETKTLDYRDLCSLSIACRSLRRLASDDSLWSPLLLSDFNSSLFKNDIDDSTSNGKFKRLYKIRSDLVASDCVSTRRMRLETWLREWPEISFEEFKELLSITFRGRRRRR